jgi:hypothetical protein
VASVLLAAVATAPTEAISSGEGPVTVESNNLLPWFDFSLSPNGLSRVEPSPGKLDLGFDFERGGFAPPANSPVSVELDRRISFEATGIPACAGLGVQGGVEPARDCAASIVGRGSVSFDIAFPEAAPSRASGPVVVYYGGQPNGQTRLYAYARLDAPISGIVKFEIDLKQIDDGRFGTEASFVVPKIAGGNGAIAELDLTLFKRFAYDGRRRSFVSATCRDGRLEATASALQPSPSGSEVPLEETSVRACTPGR